jgi:hypothetical protein
MCISVNDQYSAIAAAKQAVEQSLAFGDAARRHQLDQSARLRAAALLRDSCSTGTPWLTESVTAT